MHKFIATKMLRYIIASIVIGVVIIGVAGQKNKSVLIAIVVNSGDCAN